MTRRWLQFNLKSLLILVFVVALPCAWLAWKLDLKRRERAAVAEVKKLGGRVAYDWEDPFSEDEPPGPRWVRKLLGDDFFAHVVTVEIKEMKIDDSVFLHLKEFTDLEWLELRRCSLTGPTDARRSLTTSARLAQ